jgi:nucleotide-binding universal stress UspA family protein
MRSPHRVVVGVDESESAGRTLAWALREAAATGAEVIVVRASVPSDDVLRAGARGSVTALEVLDPSLARAVASARLTLGEQRVSIVVERDPAGDVLTHLADRDDLLVVGPPIRPGWWARSSTMYRVTTRASCPVVVVHPPAATPGQGIGHVLRSHVVTGVDGSAATNAVLAFAFSFAANHHLPVAGVTVTEHTDNDVWFDDRLLETHLAAESPAAAALAAEIEPWHLKYPGVPVKRALVAGHPEEALRRAAQGATLLVIGAAGSGVAPLGRVSRHLIESAPCPVGIARVVP